MLSEEEVRGILTMAEEAAEKSDRTVRSHFEGKAEAFRQVLERDETDDSVEKSGETGE